MSESRIPWTSHAGGFGTPSPGDDGFHGPLGSDHHAVTETWWWCFHNAEAKLHGMVYVWVHPNLGLYTGGLWANIGSKRHYLAADFFDMQVYMPGDIFDSTGNIRTANGLTVTFERPMEKARIHYADADRGFELDMTQEAFTPAIMRSNNKHFEQGMRCTGFVRLNGKEYPLDHHAIRDRSWAEPRPEDGHRLPPYTWMTAVFSEDFCFTIAAHDDPALGPCWLDHYDIAPEDVMRDAWIYDHGRQIRVARVSKLTEHGPDGVEPALTTIRATAEDGREYEFRGEVLSSLPWNTWQNMICHTGLTRWTSPQIDTTGWGVTQEVQWNDYVATFCKPPV